MPLTTKERSVCWRRTQEAFDAHQGQARAAGKCVLYRLEDLRDIVERQLARGVCPYCRGPYTPATLVIGYRVPVARGGKFTLKNLEVCCRDCHGLKGALDAEELRELFRLVDGWPRPVRRLFLDQLRAGVALTPPDLPRVGSLEWFTAGVTDPP
jgi:5-methylcytosine-specific restriction endonuclease McrA